MLGKIKSMAATGASMLSRLAPWRTPETRASVLHNNDAAVPWNNSMTESTQSMTQRPILKGIRNVRDGIFNVLSGIGLAIGGTINTGIDAASVPLDIATNAAHAAMNVKQLLDRGNLILTDVVTKGVAGVSSTTEKIRGKLKNAVAWVFGMDTPPDEPQLTLVKNPASNAESSPSKKEEQPEGKVAEAA